jgi:hypothetical protein
MWARNSVCGEGRGCGPGTVCAERTGDVGPEQFVHRHVTAGLGMSNGGGRVLGEGRRWLDGCMELVPWPVPPWSHSHSATHACWSRGLSLPFPCPEGGRSLARVGRKAGGVHLYPEKLAGHLEEVGA